MTALLERPTVSTVGGTEENLREGLELRQRRDDLGLSVHQLSEHTGIARSTIKNVEEGGARPTSFGAVRAALDRIEHEMGEGIPAAGDAPESLDLVEFRVSGNFGVSVVVKGPVPDLRELEETVMRLIQRMQSGEGDRNGESQTSP